MASENLTPKQDAFVEAYLETGNATEAYRRSYECANMKDTTINREAFALLENPKIAARLEVLRQRSAAKVTLTRAWVLERLMSNATAAVVVNDFTASNKALELLGKTDEIGGMFTDKTSATIDQKTTATVAISRLDATLADFAGERADRDIEGSVPN